MIDVACAIIFFNDKVLVTQRSERMSQPLKWEFPGGKLENGESETDCIKREIREEINIEIEVLNKLSDSIHDYGSIKIKLIPFLARYVSGSIELSEHSNYKFLPKNELMDLDWAQADIPIVQELVTLNL